MLISGLTVIAAMAGMFLTGDKTFISFAQGTILVVAIAIVSSLTVLPAVLAWLGDRVEKGRIPFLGRNRRPAGQSRFWSALVDRVMRVEDRAAMTQATTRPEPAGPPEASPPPSCLGAGGMGRRPAGAGRREYRLFLAATALVALHVADDSFLQPQPGTSAADHLVSGVVPLTGLAFAAAIYPRVRGRTRAAIALVVGFFGIVVGIEAVRYTTKVGPSGDDFTGLLSIPAGLGLLGL